MNIRYEIKPLLESKEFELSMHSSSSDGTDTQTDVARYASLADAFQRISNIAGLAAMTFAMIEDFNKLMETANDADEPEVPPGVN